MSKKLKTFTSTSNKPYDRHTYTLVFKDGKQALFDDYEMCRAAWFQWSNTNLLSHVTVNDTTPTAIDNQ